MEIKAELDVVLVYFPGEVVQHLIVAVKAVPRHTTGRA